MNNITPIEEAKKMKLTLTVKDEIITDHLDPFYQKNKARDETLEAFIVRAITSQAINASAQHDCNTLRQAMEKELNTKAQARMKEAEITANVLFGK
jgi:transcriptional regulator NrdR family protein